MHYVKDIFEDNKTKHAHDKFVRYSKGTFIGPLMKVKISGQSIKIQASFHFVDEINTLIAQVLGNQKVLIKGSLVWNEDLSTELAKTGIMYSKVTKSRGIFKYALENEVMIDDFVRILGEYNMLISFKTKDVTLATKPSFPKPNKPFTADFCKLTLPVSAKSIIFEQFLFDLKDSNVKDVEVEHEIQIVDIHLPKEINDFELARKEAKREGKIIRKVTVKGKETKTSEKNFII